MAYHHPTEQDVFTVRGSLIELLPLELVNVILDDAEYWPMLASTREVPLGVSSSSGNWCYLVTPPIPLPHEHAPIPRLRRIEFAMSSCDQGWGGEPGDAGKFYRNVDLPLLFIDSCPGTYNGSWTWFETAIIRTSYSRQVVPPAWVTHAEDQPAKVKEISAVEVSVSEHTRWHVQNNVTSSSTVKDHRVIWTPDDPAPDEPARVDPWKGHIHSQKQFLELLQPGDRIGLFARAMVYLDEWFLFLVNLLLLQFPGWHNNVHRASVEIFYSV